MSDTIDELRVFFVEIVARQTRIEQRLNMMLDTLQMHFPLMTALSVRLDCIADNLARLTRDANGLAKTVKDIRTSITDDGR